ncbi:VOC family protein [Pseudomonas sp. RIT-PI-S]|uniref:2-oxoadipate dioxygenase/decarboxylase HglS n=1 Tax=Pseudomonas sp. RIT-PI-S TaxID=3035295 RepID=UPI0021DB2FB8|nr:VOC family protein [Pseudomonas sp. RIT-PI-S]
MPTTGFANPDDIRARFSQAMSAMYQAEVPLYGDLLELVAEVNRETLAAQPALAEALRSGGELERLDEERHGAIRVGSAEELATLARLFAVMGMQPVGYYDLASAGVPVHSTAFRAVHEDSLRISPFRVFTSLLRLELIDDLELRALAADLLAKRQIFTARALALIERHETQGGLTDSEAQAFVTEALETFRWHRQATVSGDQYRQLHGQHRLIADVVAFKGPHINHLTPRTLDIDRVQQLMPTRGIEPKAVIEGPPARRQPILLRQTSFKALEEQVAFNDPQGLSTGSHTARFGEIEQRGAALTPAGRALYDQLLAKAQADLAGVPAERDPHRYSALLQAAFASFPDDVEQLRAQGLAWFRYAPTAQGLARAGRGREDLESLLAQGDLRCEPVVYEDFLPVSAAGIFQSNLGSEARGDYGSHANRAQFEQALGRPVVDEMELYALTQLRSLQACEAQLGVRLL